MYLVFGGAAWGIRVQQAHTRNAHGSREAYLDLGRTFHGLLKRRCHVGDQSTRIVATDD